MQYCKQHKSIHWFFCQDFYCKAHDSMNQTKNHYFSNSCCLVCSTTGHRVLKCHLHQERNCCAPTPAPGALTLAGQNVRPGRRRLCWRSGAIFRPFLLPQVAHSGAGRRPGGHGRPCASRTVSLPLQAPGSSDASKVN